MSQPNRYQNLNALRALSAIGILLMHYQANMSAQPQYGYISELIIPWLTNLVLLFFILSAFGLCCGYYERFRNCQIAPQQFYAKRYARILPFFIFLSAIDIAASFSWESLAQGFMNATLTLGLMPVPQVSVIGVGWFLGTIFVFYMLFPFFVFLMDTRRKAWVVLGIAYVINLLCYYYFFTKEYGVGVNPARMNILYSAIFMISGGLIYLYKDRIFRVNTGTARYAFAILAIVVTLLYFILHPYYSDNHALLMIADVAIFVSWVLYSVAPAKRWMDNRVMNFLGKYSMEIYLSHMVIFRVLERMPIAKHITDPNISYIVICVLGILLTIAFSFCAVKFLDFCNKHLAHRLTKTAN